MKRGIKRIVIEARRWSDKVDGNTYHSVKVYVNDKFVGRKPYAHGSDDQFLESAHKILQKAGVYRKKEDYSKFRQDLFDHCNKFTLAVADVYAPEGFVKN